MCLIILGHDHHPDYPLVFAGNRDEFYGRPTVEASFWDDAPHVLGGRDLKSGGTWLGVTRRGFWATVTNVRDQTPHRSDAPSRGGLVADYLREEPAPEAYLHDVAGRADRYNGFNLLLGTPQSVYHFSNREEGPPRQLESGIHGISNGQLNEPWPKVERGKKRVRSILTDEPTPKLLLEVLNDREPAPDEDLPDTGVGIERERTLSPPFIDLDSYGTRSSTVLLIHRTGTVTFVERTFERGQPQGTRRFTFEIPEE